MTVLKTVKRQMKELQDRKRTDLETIQAKQNEARTAINTAKEAMEKATEEMNVDKYEAARNAKQKAETALSMYAGRQKQLNDMKYITEEESDKVISSLLQYEKELEESYTAAIKEPIRHLNGIQKAYLAEVDDVEETIRTWTRTVHPNYRSDVSTYYEAETGRYTNRSPKPIPVRQLEYGGCAASRAVGTFLKEQKEFLSEE